MDPCRNSPPPASRLWDRTPVRGGARRRASADLLTIWGAVLPLGRDRQHAASRPRLVRASVFLGRAAWFVIDLPALVRLYVQARRALRQFARPMLVDVFDARAWRPGDDGDVLARAQRDFTRLHMLATAFAETAGVRVPATGLAAMSLLPTLYDDVFDDCRTPPGASLARAEELYRLADSFLDGEVIDLRALPPLERVIIHLGATLLDELPAAACEAFLGRLRELHEAQVESVRFRATADAKAVDVGALTANTLVKGGLAFILLASVRELVMSEKDEEVAFLLGGAMQILDDVEDVAVDRAEAVATLPAIYQLTAGDVEALWQRVHRAFAEREATGELRRAATRRYLRWSDIYVWKTVASWRPAGRGGAFWRAFDALMRFTFMELGDPPASREALARQKCPRQKDYPRQTKRPR